MVNDLGIVIGRFAPFHNGHRATIDASVRACRRTLVVVGSHGPRTSRTPWTHEERSRMIRSVFGNAQKVLIHAQPDIPKNDAEWANQIKKKVELITIPAHTICMYTNEKEPTIWLNQLPRLFPKYEHRLTKGIPNLHAADLRREYFAMNRLAVYDHVPRPVADYLDEYLESDFFWDAYDAYIGKSK